MDSGLSQHRIKMEALEEVLSQYEQAELKVEHHFAHGTYTRVLYLPAGTILTGKIHRHSCVNIVMQGRIAVLTDEGDKEIVAPYVFVSGAGVKKAGAVLEDTIWVNVQPWDRDWETILTHEWR
jgi:hypothetical protein